MDTVYQKYKKCGVKINTEIAGCPVLSSGFLYVTSPNNRYNYVFTTKHTFKESHDDDEISIKKIAFIEILCLKENVFDKYAYIKPLIIEERLIVFKQDLVMIKVLKNDSFTIPGIQVSDLVNGSCKTWSVTNAKSDDLLLLELESKDVESSRYTIQHWKNPEPLEGCSGSGIFSSTSPILYGFIMSYPTDELQGEYIDAVKITFEKINNRLDRLGLERLSTPDSYRRRIVNENEFVDINNVQINAVYVNMELAMKRIKFDSADDWFYDPLNFVDLSNVDFLFDYFKDYFFKTDYNVSPAEIFYLPKKTFTLRKAMVLSYPERIYYTALVEVLGPRLDECLHPLVYSARYNKFANKGIMISGFAQWRKMQYLLQDYSNKYKYVIEIDMLNYYDNIDIEILYDKISAVCISSNERKANKELKKTLLKFSKNSKVGIPQNSDASSLLATFYLNQVDTYMRHHVPAYIRFMDDIRIFTDNKFEARRLLTLVEKELRRLKLSLNGQKTKIINLNPNKKEEQEEINIQYRSFFDLDSSKLSRFSNSNNTDNINEAFHLAVKLLIENIGDDSIGNTIKGRKLNQALTSVRKCCSKGVNIDKESKIYDFMKAAGNLLINRPWVTPQVCTLIGIMKKKDIPEEFWNKAIEIVLERKYNTYSWQCYHIWLLLAKHRIYKNELSKFANNCLDSNDETTRPVIAAMMIYMGSIDKGYRRVILRKYKDGFIHGNFQERLALITLRAFESDDVFSSRNSSLAIHKSLNKFKHKDLVYIAGDNDNTEIDLEFLQINSL